jgi:hypothetical protein
MNFNVGLLVNIYKHYKTWIFKIYSCMLITKGGKYLEKLSEYSLIKKEHEPRSELFSK